MGLDFNADTIERPELPAEVDDIESHFSTDTIDDIILNNASDNYAGSRIALTDLKMKTEKLATQARHAVSKLKAVETDIEPLIDGAQAMLDSLECGFVAHSYTDINAILCNDVLSSMALMVVAMMTMVIAGCVACGCSIRMGERSQWMRLITDEAFVGHSSLSDSSTDDQYDEVDEAEYDDLIKTQTKHRSSTKKSTRKSTRKNGFNEAGIDTAL